MFKSIVVPIDIAHRSSWQHAIPEGIQMATVTGGKLTVMTVVREVTALFEARYLTFMLEQAMSDARYELRTIVSQHPAGTVAVSQNVRFGGIGREILAEAVEQEADLILMASHRPEMRDYLIGPNAAHVARHARCSVLVLRK